MHALASAPDVRPRSGLATPTALAPRLCAAEAAAPRGQPPTARHAARSSIPALRCAKALARPRLWPARSGGDGSDTVYPSGGMTVWGGLSWVVAPLCLGAHPLVR